MIFFKTYNATNGKSIRFITDKKVVVYTPDGGDFYSVHKLLIGNMDGSQMSTIASDLPPACSINTSPNQNMVAYVSGKPLYCRYRPKKLKRWLTSNRNISVYFRKENRSLEIVNSKADEFFTTSYDIDLNKFYTSSWYINPWSPDNKQLAYCSNRNGNSDIFIYDFRKNQSVQITSMPDHDTSPSYSPNGKWICYISENNVSQKLFIVRSSYNPLKSILK